MLTGSHAATAVTDAPLGMLAGRKCLEKGGASP